MRQAVEAIQEFDEDVEDGGDDVTNNKVEQQQPLANVVRMPVKQEDSQAKYRREQEEREVLRLGRAFDQYRKDVQRSNQAARRGVAKMFAVTGWKNSAEQFDYDKKAFAGQCAAEIAVLFQFKITAAGVRGWIKDVHVERPRHYNAGQPIDIGYGALVPTAKEML